MDYTKKLGKAAFGTRLKLLTEKFLQDAGKVYKYKNIEFEPRWFVMFSLLSEISPLSITEITAELGFTQPAVTQIANILIEKKLVKAVTHKTDTRVKLLELTAKAKKLIPELKPVWEGFNSAINDLFYETGYDVLKVIDNIESALEKKDMFTRVKEKIN
jgi:DNA-binding MarR family transcriptional regulator